MIRLMALWAVVLGAVAFADGPAPFADAGDIDLAAFANGALVESVSSDYGGSWQANWLTDENPAIGWATQKGAALPVSIVISLPESSEIHAVSFDTAQAESPDRGAKDIDVFVSSTSATDGFTLATAVSLKPAEDGQNFPLPTPASGVKFIKLVVKSSNGSSDYAEIMEFRAMGKQLTTTPLPNVSGTYEASHFGTFHLAQDGAQLTGCYEYDGGLVVGGLESHLMRLTWTQTQRKGPAVMVLARDGKSFHGWWAYEEEPNSWQADWDLKKISDKVGSCPHWNPKTAGGDAVGQQLATEGRVRLYGINFDVDKDTLRADAKPAVGALLAALKEHADWKVTIEGHTDSTGGEAHNLDLSQRRADAVKAALVASGIDAGRLTTKGFGQSKPVASNDSEIGRAQNRRVEVAKE